ncbi:MAG: hypothetical protein HY557_07995, partial [Euryarchaeota archaeon]|nr:hypothetical protein [Euryarchaeota archaeon]
NLFVILTPQADYDPVRAAAGAMIADAMRQVGLNAASKPTAFGEIVNRITVHDFDLYILGWRIGGTDPDYLFNFFHSSQAAAGQNYPGFNNAQYDQVIDDSRRELDRTTRRALIFQAQLILAEQRPYDVLYYRTNIEGYRQDRFVNWTVASGSIWNFWSLQGIQPPSVVSMRATISVESATQSGATETITVTVLDNEARALQGASVELSVDAGSVSIGACTATTCTGTTDVTGVVRSTFQAPDVTAESTVIIQATARHPDFTPITRNAVIRVFPLGAQFLSLKLELPVGDRVTAGQSVPMSVTVRDQDRALASDATVQIASEDPNKLTPNPASGTAADVAQVTLGAAATISAADTLTITVTATRAGFTDALASVDISVVPTGEATRLCPDGSRRPLSEPCPTVATPGLDVLPILAGIGIAALVAGVVARRKKRS